jgi:putative transcriptional regulator
MAIVVDIDVLLTQRGMSVGQFAQEVGISPANVAVLKNGRGRAIRFSTLDAICRVLGCGPGDVLRYVPADEDNQE